MALLKLLLLTGLLLLGGCSFPEYVTQQQPSPLGTCEGTACEGESRCTANEQCVSGYCDAGACAAGTCTDGVKDRAETDVDCGGSDGCPACGVGQRCVSAYDCNGGGCVTGRCQAPSCADGLQNQSETDVDCGGSDGCDRCAAKQHCEASTDCDAGSCAQGRCQPPTCDDQVRNGDETDVDCGGSCAMCADFARCAGSRDCTSGVCDPGARVCQPPTCSDGVQNGTESETDCGRDCEARCATMKTCHTDADCQSSTCSEGRCVPSEPTGQALVMTSWVATASSNYSPDTEPSRALDGNLGTHWTNGTGQLPGMWFQVDMREQRPIFAVELACDSNDDYPRKLRVLVSEDGQSYTAATPTVAGTKRLRLDLGRARIARYVKLELDHDTGGTWWRIDELRVIE